MKALILSGGRGTRLHPITHTHAKQLIPIANKPVIFYAIEKIVSAGITDIGIVVGETHKEIKAVVGDGKRFGHDISITYIQQENALGLAHAVKIAQPFLGNDLFLMFLGDNFIGDDLREQVEQFCKWDCDYHAQVFLSRVTDPQQFGIAQLETYSGQKVDYDTLTTVEDLRLLRVVEKPRQAESNLALTGVYFFDPNIFEAVNAIQPSARGELEITDAIQYLIDHDYTIRPYLLQKYWVDTGKMQDMLDANRTVLSHMQSRIKADVVMDQTSQVYGQVILEENVHLINSVVRGPSIIGRNVTLTNTYVGPFTSIDRDTAVANSEIECSIILEGCTIRDVDGRIEDSLIGRYTQIYPSSTRPHAHKLLLGDHSCIGNC